MSAASADYMRNALAGCGALVAGRHVFDIAEGWGGTHPLGGVPIFVVTHEPPTDWPHTEIFTFVDGSERRLRLRRTPLATGTSRWPAPRSPSNALLRACSTQSTSTSCRSCSVTASGGSRTSAKIRSTSTTRRSSRGTEPPNLAYPVIRNS